ncbi:hypothetical protein HDZ31DRAFT_45987 [Schizophyllum fasciatum]
MSDTPWIPKNTVEETLRLMTSPGALLETETACIDGRVYRVYKNLPPSCRALWLSAVRMYAEREYVAFEGQRLTFRAVHARARRAAAIFRDVYGVRKGDHVGLVARNVPEYLVVFWACHLLGAVPALINASLTQESILHSIVLCDCKLILVDRERADLLEPVVGQLLAESHAKDILVLESHEGKGSWEGMKPWAEVYAAYETDAAPGERDGATSEGDDTDVVIDDPGVGPEDDAVILFSSGTGSLMPKACLSTQRALLTNLFNVISNGHRATIRRGDRPVSGVVPPPMGVFYPTPIFGAIGTWGRYDRRFQLLATFVGAKLVYIREYDVKEGDLIKKEDINTQNAVHDLIELASTDLAGHQFITVGVAGGAVHRDFAQRAREAFPGAMIGQGYGMTEMNASCVTTSAEDFFARPLSCGTRCPVVDVLVVDENGKSLPPGHSGEIWVRGPNAMKCYYNDPEATEKFMTKDGWCRTGDIGTVCAEGFMYITDRKKDMIIRDGLNIGSISIENALYADRGVVEAAAVPVPDERSGELPVAVAVVKAEYRGKTTEVGLLDLLRKKLPKHAVPVLIVLANEPLKRNAAGKVMKAGVRELATIEWQKRRGDATA